MPNLGQTYVQCERNEIWDLSLLGRGVRHKILYPRFALLNWHCWSTFDLSQILVSSDTQLLSKPELIAHPQSLMGLSGIKKSRPNYLISSRRPAVLTMASKLVSSGSSRRKFTMCVTSLTVNAALTVQSVNWHVELLGLRVLLGLLGSTGIRIRRNCKLWQQKQS